MYDYEFYENNYEQSIFDEIMNETLTKLKEATSENIKGYYKQLEEENELLKKENKRMQQLVNEIESMEKELEYKKSILEENVKREKLSALMKEFEITLYRVDTEYLQKPKCDKCDSKRRIEYRTPSGKKAFEDCCCAERIINYKPAEYICSEFRANKLKENILAWYKRSVYDGDDYYSYDANVKQEKIYNEQMEYKRIDKYNTFFRTEKECQQYCEFLNKKEEI